MSIYVCTRCDHYRNNDFVQAFAEEDGLVCEYCLDDHEGIETEVDPEEVDQ